MQKTPRLAYGSSERSPWKKVHGLHLLDEGSPLWSVLYLSGLCRRQRHPSLSLLILFFPARLPIGSSMFWFAAFMFPDLCTHRPSPGFALWHSPAKTHKTNFNITCSRHIENCCCYLWNLLLHPPPPPALWLLLLQDRVCCCCFIFCYCLVHKCLCVCVRVCSWEDKCFVLKSPWGRSFHHQCKSLLTSAKLTSEVHYSLGSVCLPTWISNF